MSKRNPGKFCFRQFDIHQDKSAMKVGTDSVLLAAWLRVAGKKRALDMGSGTGVMTIMLAQRNPDLLLEGVEIDPSSAEQGAENARNSPWGERIRIICGDINRFEPESPYDLILSNPPFYHADRGSLSKNTRVAAGRQTLSLTYEQLIRRGAALLAPGGHFNVIIPAVEGERFLEIAAQASLFCSRKTEVHPLPERAPHRWLLELSPAPAECRNERLTVEVVHHSYTEEWKELLREFYIRF